MRVDAEGTLHVPELGGNPYLPPDSCLPQVAGLIGTGCVDLPEEIIRETIKRHPDQRRNLGRAGKS
jgi:hypothetical protein